MISDYKRVTSDRRGRRRKPAADKALRRPADVLLLVVISGVGALGLNCGGPPLGSPDTENTPDAGGVSAPQTPAPSQPGEEDCANGIDDDGDGGADCDDIDCVQAAACAVPPLDHSAPTSTADMAEFLYTDEDSAQKEVDPASFEVQRIAVVRGQVLDRADQPMSGVRVTIAREPAYGYTETDATGAFNLVINGGGRVTVQYEKIGFLPAQRTIQTKWQSFHWMPEVMLLQRDPVVTEITTGVATVQVAQGSPVQDENGARQVTLLFPAGVTAHAVDADGHTIPLTKLSVRATEYTVGGRGPQAMPGTLPPASAYTFAVEFSVDEADTLGATTIVVFDKPVGLYVDNFLGFPVGESVPVGYYDHAKSQWIPSQDGIVLAIVDTAGGIATIDVDGDDVAEDGATLLAMGIDQGERAELATLYEPGTTLWWAPIPHFSPWDCNWPYGLPDGAAGPSPELLDRLQDLLDRPCERSGSIIACESQVLGERIGIPATPMVLSYQTNRTAGYAQDVTRDIALSNGPLSDLVQGVELEITIAGQRQIYRYDPKSDTTELKHTFTWNRRDGYGRVVQGAHYADIRVGYEFQAVYRQGRGFGNPGGAMVTGVRARQVIMLSRAVRVPLGGWNARALGFGGFSPTVHHVYNPATQTLYTGDGGRRRAQSVTQVLKRVAPGLTLDLTNSLVAGPDGSIYTSRRVDSTTEIVRIFPDGSHAILHTESYVTAHHGMALGADGTLYVADTTLDRIVAYAPDGGGAYVAGGGTPQHGIGDGGPATEAQLDCPCRVALGPDASLYITEQGQHRIRRVDPAGIITTFATLDGPRDIAVTPAGTVYVAHGAAPAQVSRIRPDGITELVASDTGYSGLALGTDGAIYALGTDVVQQVHANGDITDVAGGGVLSIADGEVATSVRLGSPQGLTRGPDDSLYFVDWNGEQQIYRLTRALPDLGADAIIIPADDGTALYIFDSKGHHLETRDALTGVTLLAFVYDAHWRLTAIVDRDGLQTQITRNADGLATAIIGPYGQRTELACDPAQRLARVRYPDEREVSVGYNASDLLVWMRDFRDGWHEYRYDARGRLTSDTGPTGFTQSLQGHQTPDGYEVTVTTSAGRVTRYGVSRPDGKTQKRTTELTSGLVGEEIRNDAVVHRRAPDGTVTQVQLGPDPRFGMATPYARQATLITPQGRTLLAIAERVAELADPQNPLSLVRLTNERTVLGRTSKTVFDTSTRTIEHTSPAGRRITLYLNDQGRPSEVHRPGLAPVQYEYDDDGRLTSRRQGSGDRVRRTDFDYNAKGFLAFRTDALKQVYAQSTDLVGRVLWATAPDQTTVEFAYDAHNNITAITPPGRPSHGFHFNAADLPLRSEPPLLAGRATSTAFHYDNDLALQRIDLADGRRIALHYDDAGRIEAISTSPGDISNVYSPSKGHLTDIVSSDGNGIHLERDGPLLLVESWTGDVAGWVMRDYDAAFRMASILVSGPESIPFGYDDDDLLTQAGPLSITRDPDTGFVRATQVGAVATALDFNAFGEPTHAGATCNADPLYEADFLRDALARIDVFTETVLGEARSVDYGYDALGRVVDVIPVQGGGPERSYDYDDNGNRLAITEDGETMAADYDAQDQLRRYGTTEYLRSDVGDRVGKLDTMTGAATGYDVDEFGNLRSVTLPDGTLIEYIIDGLNRRIGKRVNGALQYGLLYADGLRPIARLSPSGDVEAIYIYATLAHAPDLIIEPGGNVYRIVHDHVGSPRLVVNVDTCEVVQRLEYDEFGRVLLDTNPGFSPFGFAGGLYDPDTGLVRFGARDYDAEIGRWTSKDPAGFGGGDTNLYAYAGSDPVNYVDPNGEIAFLLPLAWAIAKGAVVGAAVDGGIELATQLIQNGGELGCVDWGDVGASAGTGAVMSVAGRGISVFKGLRAAREAGGKADDLFHVTPDGVALPKGPKHKIPDGYVENPHRSGSYGEVVDGKFRERLRIDPATPPGRKGPNHSHYHRDGKGTHYSPAPGGKDPGFQP